MRELVSEITYLKFEASHISLLICGLRYLKRACCF